MAIKQTIGLLLTAIIFSGGIYAEKLATLPEIQNPTGLTIAAERFYVIEGTRVSIYSFKDFKLINQFGKKGEGPQEFMHFARVVPQPDDLFVYSFGKIAYYTKDGIFKSEKRALSISFKFTPLGDKYVGIAFDMKDGVRYNSISIFDSDLKREKVLYSYKRVIQDAGNIDPVDTRDCDFFISDNKIFFDDKDGNIRCCDDTGKQLFLIETKIPGIKVTRADEERYRNHYKKDPQYKDIYHMIENRIKFPSLFPPIQYFEVVDKKIYVVTFKKKDDKFEYMVYDIKGKLLKKDMTRLLYGSAIELFPTSAKDGKIFQLIENEKEVVWELHSHTII
jgi:hypothetical protein